MNHTRSCLKNLVYYLVVGDSGVQRLVILFNINYSSIKTCQLSPPSLDQVRSFEKIITIYYHPCIFFKRPFDFKSVRDL
jgi:hypothetical protein